MGHLSLYRKYRSQTFSDLIGQAHVTKTLQNALASGRVAHSYLFTGPRGTGKTSTARLLAKALCCEKGPGPEPCNECEICLAITAGNCVDVLEMDAASEAGVDQVREAIVQTVEYRPMQARYRVFVIDEVHDLSAKAFDALLKTIEEPPEHVVFILATTEYSKVPPTIRSRCQKFEFHRATIADLVQRMQFICESEKVQAEPQALTALARMADGGFRDALTLLEQVILTSDAVTLERVYDQLGLISDELVDALLLAIRMGEVSRIVELVSEATRMGRDPRAILESCLYRLADMTRAAYGVEVADIGDPTREAALHDAAMKIGRDRMLRIRARLSQAFKAIRDVSLPKLWLEAELIGLALDQQEPEHAKEPKKPEPTPQIHRTTAAAAPQTKNGEPSQPEPARAAKPQPEPEPTDDPDLAAARKLWQSAIGDLPSNVPIALHLAGSRVKSIQGTQAEIELARKMDVDWITEKPQRQAYVVKQLTAAGAGNWRVRFVAPARKQASPEVVTVDLALEGQSLVDAASEALNGGAEREEHN